MNDKTEEKKPLNTLNESRNKKVMIELKTKQKFSGVLKAFDIHINTVLDEAVELNLEGNPIRTIGKVFIRGDTIILISPQ